MAGLLVAAALLAGCAQTTAFVGPDLKGAKGREARILLMPTDVLVQEVEASGLPVTNAAWTRQGETSLTEALDRVLRGKKAAMLSYRAAGAGDDPHLQLLKLHEAVGSSIIVHKYIQNLALPTKKEKFDWTLGPDAARLRDEYDADYALFVYFRDSFASAGRVAVIFIGALLGVGIQGGQQVGFASLVDLSDGDVIWFNVLRSGVGDIRTPDGALGATESLLDDFPL